jgi:imidazole glycerol phosphate synthase subunit HisF
MLRPRIIPCLLVHQGGLVKTLRFKDPKYVGDPINAVKIFNEKEAQSSNKQNIVFKPSVVKENGHEMTPKVNRSKK